MVTELVHSLWQKMQEIKDFEKKLCDHCKNQLQFKPFWKDQGHQEERDKSQKPFQWHLTQLKGQEFVERLSSLFTHKLLFTSSYLYFILRNKWKMHLINITRFCSGYYLYNVFFGMYFACFCKCWFFLETSWLNAK